ncbi:MAG: threonylcarbamoyl-AMP synthase [Bacteroidia bacterium]|jgi:L-threonylcarbamoyladenylate synthase|nr:threonylcarbamoyl-AMP synthase [Bacteroidia bacterium]MCC6768965.1 threonylcarbamoyl-AMP synthase [Bacteroidia bacterium]
MAIISQETTLAVAYLQNDVVAIPTETVYGLAANALRADLVARIFEVKARPTFDPLIVHTCSLEQVERLVTSFPAPLKALAKAFWPGPLTLLLPKSNVIPDIVTSGLNRVGIRMPDHAITLKLIEQCGFPLAAPSANPFGYISPTKPEHVQAQLGEKIPMILDGGPCKVGIESTIVGIENGKPAIYRLGGIAPEAIMEHVGEVDFYLTAGSNPGAPGMLLAHYAPRKPLFIEGQTDDKKLLSHEKTFFIQFEKLREDISADAQYILSPQGNIQQAAIQLFEALHQAEQHAGSEQIIAQKVPAVGLGPAINDRLQRAAYK